MLMMMTTVSTTSLLHIPRTDTSRGIERRILVGLLILII